MNLGLFLRILECFSPVLLMLYLLSFQVNVESKRCHTTPITLLPVFVNLYRCCHLPCLLHHASTSGGKESLCCGRGWAAALQSGG